MKTVLNSFLLVSILGAGAYAQCAYFRLSADLLKCEAADPRGSNDANAYQPMDLPEFQEAGPQALVQVNCSCEYSLSGSDPRCDMEETLERSSVIGVDNLTATCHRGKILCKDVCPSRLP